MFSSCSQVKKKRKTGSDAERDKQTGGPETRVNIFSGKTYDARGGCVDHHALEENAKRDTPY